MMFAAVWGLMMAMVGEMKACPEDKTSSGRSSVFSRQSSRLEIVNSYPGLSLEDLKKRHKSFHEQFQQAVREDETVAIEWNALQQLREGLIKVKEQRDVLKSFEKGTKLPFLQQSFRDSCHSKENDQKEIQQKEAEKKELFEKILEEKQGHIATTYKILQKIEAAIQLKKKNKPSSF